MATHGAGPARWLSGTTPRHLVVSLLLRHRSVFVSSVAVAPGRPPQLLAAGHPWLAAVTRGDEVVHLSRMPDPYGGRGIRVDGSATGVRGRAAVGRAVMAVPFESVADLTRSRLHVLDLGSPRPGADPQRLGGELGRRLTAGTGVRTLGFEAITASPQWATVGRLLGLRVEPARFEVFEDEAGLWRWRLRRAGGDIVAASGDGFGSRPQAEAEVAWIRRHAAGSPTTSPH